MELITKNEFKKAVIELAEMVLDYNTKSHNNIVLEVRRDNTLYFSKFYYQNERKEKIMGTAFKAAGQNDEKEKFIKTINEMKNLVMFDTEDIGV